MNERLKSFLKEIKTTIREMKIDVPTYGWLLSHDNAAGMTGTIW